MFHSVTATGGSVFLTVNALFGTKADADTALAFFEAVIAAEATNVFTPAVPLAAAAITGGPGVYTFLSKTSSAEFQILPTGMNVQSVSFNTNCMETGCWVIDLIYTTGEDNFNVFYIPEAVGNDTLSVDFDYSTPDAVWTGMSPLDTFQPRNFPCGSTDYVPGVSDITKVTACCIPQFLDMYRPVNTFATDLLVTPINADNTACNAATPIFDKNNMPASALSGTFSGMTSATVTFQSEVDPFIKQYTAQVQLDEKELRQNAGMMSGTVGVEYTVDTFIGLANFKPTGLEFLDMFAMQVLIHLEKTSFFSVATHGENQYTFLEYVNVRLIAVYNEDTDFSENSSEQTKDFSRTDSTAAAHYMQVTFTIGAQYQPIETGIIPLDSVLISKGDFIASANTVASRFHACSQYTDGTFTDKTTFDSRFPDDIAGTQSCAPDAIMCNNPASTPDQFVSFNIPLGIDWLPAASGNLDSNVFVDMVVSVIDQDQIDVVGGTPNAGDDAEQMKTTLTASIPVVDGGVNIFCDGLTAKTDLLDVANADLIIGSASSNDEMSRLRILVDVASGNLGDGGSGPQQVDSDSIEAGLMTLVVKGDASYFNLGGTGLFKIEVEDIITVHVMEPDSGTTFPAIVELLNAAGEDNAGVGGLDTDGYALNGAFRFAIDRAANTAKLQPTAELLTHCAFNPGRPDPADAFPETCVIRRDIDQRTFPSRGGAAPTAIELPDATVAENDAARDAVASFMQGIMGESDYADQLGRTFSYLVSQKYSLNGKFNRAFWINPGYEWTPTQTGGQELFTLSQKLIMFALVNLNEGYSRRRMLLQTGDSATANTGSGVSNAIAEFDVTPASMMASAYNIPEELVATFNVQLQLTQQEACMSDSMLRRAVRDTLDEYSSTTTSATETVQVQALQIDRAGVQCGRRSLARKLHSYTAATATVEMMLVFSAGKRAEINMDKFATQSGINFITKLVVSDLINTVSEKTFVPTFEKPAPGVGTTTNSEDTNQVQTQAPAPAAETPAASGGISMTTLAVLFVVGMVAVGGGYFGWKKYRSSSEHEVEVISTVNVADLKGAIQEA